ncbi:MAG: carbonic anhydrase [Arcobacter sp.]|nr:carbonic anhydrase [Arcobacter sp.]
MILKQLIQGHKVFQSTKTKSDEEKLKALAQYGQNPEVLVVGCSDSRVNIDTILNTNPGDIFTLRNVGNFVPPYKHDEDFHGSAAAIEFAVAVLKVKHIIICGHSQCGACQSLYVDIPDTSSLVHVKTWLKLGQKAKEQTLKEKKFTTKKEMYRQTEKNSIKNQMKNLLTYPDIKKFLKEGTLEIHGWHYDIATGNIDYYDEQEDCFKSLRELEV